jgi:hypothetical protein
MRALDSHQGRLEAAPENREDIRRHGDLVDVRRQASSRVASAGTRSATAPSSPPATARTWSHTWAAWASPERQRRTVLAGTGGAWGLPGRSNASRSTTSQLRQRQRAGTTRPKFFPGWTLERECRSTLTWPWALDVGVVGDRDGDVAVGERRSQNELSAAGTSLCSGGPQSQMGSGAWVYLHIAPGRRKSGK